jgi:hypothetical protein
VRRLVAVLPWLVAGCPSGPSKPVAQPSDLAASSDDEVTHLAHLAGELQDDILTSYDRDEPPELGSGMIDRKIGTARIGPGPGDVYIADDLARAPSRWPLDLDPATRTEVRSKRLEIQISADQTAAWMADELSWRIKMCGRTAAIPLRLTALYAHDGDRWVPVFEHLSFGLPPMPLDAPLPKAIKTAVLSGDLKDELSGILWRGLFRTPHDPLVAAQDPSALVLGPDAGDEWHAAHVLEARLPAGKLEDRRVGTVGRRSDKATVAYWIGNYIASIPARPGVPAGKARMRVTHVFEKRRLATRDTKGTDARSCAEDPVTKKQPADCRWLLVQSHMSQPITDDELTKQVFGTALISPKPLELDCSDRPRPTAPAAAPRPGATPPAA